MQFQFYFKTSYEKKNLDIIARERQTKSHLDLAENQIKSADNV